MEIIIFPTVYYYNKGSSSHCGDVQVTHSSGKDLQRYTSNIKPSLSISDYLFVYYYTFFHLFVSNITDSSFEIENILILNYLIETIVYNFRFKSLYPASSDAPNIPK